MKYVKNSKYFQRHWVVNTIKNDVKFSGIYRGIELIEGSTKIIKLERRRRLWKFVKPWVDERMADFGLYSVDVFANSCVYSYFYSEEEKSGHWGKHTTHSHIRDESFIPYEEIVYKLIKTIFKQHWDGHSENIHNKLKENRSAIRKALSNGASLREAVDYVKKYEKQTIQAKTYSVEFILHPSSEYYCQMPRWRITLNKKQPF